MLGETPKDIELFLPTEKAFVYIHDGGITAKYTKYGLMTEIKEERGSVLDAMAKFEFIISEMLRISIGGLKPNKISIEVNRTLSYKQRINVLEKLEMLNTEIAKNLRTIVDVRNSLAHKFLVNKTIWNKKPLFEKGNFENFKQSLQQTWDELIKEYTKMISGPELDAIKKDLKIS